MCFDHSRERAHCGDYKKQNEEDAAVDSPPRGILPGTHGRCGNYCDNSSQWNCDGQEGETPDARLNPALARHEKRQTAGDDHRNHRDLLQMPAAIIDLHAARHLPRLSSTVIVWIDSLPPLSPRSRTGSPESPRKLRQSWLIGRGLVETAVSVNVTSGVESR